MKSSRSFHRWGIQAASALIIAVGGSHLSPAQTQPPLGNHPNAQLASASIQAKVEALLSQMTLEEKAGQLAQYTVPRQFPGMVASQKTATAAAINPDAAVNLDPMQLAATGRLGSIFNTFGAGKTNEYQRAAVTRSRLHIPILFGADVIHGYHTIYPIPLGLAASFDPAMVAELSHMAGQEATAAGIRWVFSPMVDISRDARWGRAAEGAGEDPYLGSAMARAYVRGYQGEDLSQPGNVAVSVKHFAAYGAAEAGREYNTTDMSEVLLRQVYLQPYQAAVEAGAATLMSSFNALNGTPATANPFLMTKVLRDEWGFDGFVVSDYTAVKELVNHGIALDGATAAQKALQAGVDMDMMSHLYDASIPALVQQGRLSMATVDEAVRRVLRVKFAMGLFDRPYAEETPEAADLPGQNREMARKAAEESFVLLKNAVEGGKPMLPITREAKMIALIGPLANEGGEMGGTWAMSARPENFVSIHTALQAHAAKNGGRVVYAKGTDIDSRSEAGFGEAVEAAKHADVVVMALGESSRMSGEAASRTKLDLPGNQQKLLEAVAATGKEVILLVFSGRPLVLTAAADKAAAILEVWFPGVEAGNAIANVLYGQVAPSGKLPMSFPRSVGQEPLYYNQLPTGRPPTGIDLSKPVDFPTKFVSRYIDEDNNALYPFGYGLSYTTFAYSPVQLSRKEVPLAEIRTQSNQLVTATVSVTNRGSLPATEVVQCYVRNLGASVEQPVRTLKGFKRVILQPAQTVKVAFPLGYRELGFYNSNAIFDMEATHYTVWIGGDSRATQGADFVVR